MKNIYLFSILILLLSFSCTKEKPLTEEDFLGKYRIDNYHIYGIVWEEYWDTIYETPNYRYIGYDTINILNDYVEIISPPDSVSGDSLIVTNLLYGFETYERRDIISAVENDTLRFHKETPWWYTTNSLLSGYITLKDDSIFLDYRWDRSITYPLHDLISGTVKAKGVKLQ